MGPKGPTGLAERRAPASLVPRRHQGTQCFTTRGGTPLPEHRQPRSTAAYPQATLGEEKHKVEKRPLAPSGICSEAPTGGGSVGRVEEKGWGALESPGEAIRGRSLFFRDDVHMYIDQCTTLLLCIKHTHAPFLFALSIAITLLCDHAI
jgi:hypothetical protein